MRVVRPVEAPGNNLQIPGALTPELFFRQIGGDCEEYADKFETIEEVFQENGFQLRDREIPVH